MAGRGPERCGRGVSRDWRPAAGRPDARGQPKKVTVVKAARLIDGQGGAPMANPVVVIEDDRIARVGAGLPIPAGAEVIDLGSATLLPGLIDCHTHITGQPGENYYDDIFRKSPIDVAVTAHVYARRTLEAGFTTVRDVGAGEFIDVAMRNAINRGEIVGPRMQVATLAVSATGGHGDLSGFSPYLSIQEPRTASPTASTRSASWCGPR